MTKEKLSKYISLTDAVDMMEEEAGVTITRPTLKSKLQVAHDTDEDYEGILIQTSAGSWHQIHRQLFNDWIEEHYDC